MRVFISSLIRDMGAYRDAAEAAARALDYDVVRAEEFGAAPDSPQRACLAAVRAADVVILILGARYGDPQASGLSPTHEEFAEAKGTRPVLAFVLSGVQREAAQDAFVREVRNWDTGSYTANYASPQELATAVTTSLHRLALAQQAGPVDATEMLQRAEHLLSPPRSDLRASFSLAVAGGPRVQILRPSEMDRTLALKLQQRLQFGSPCLFDPAEATNTTFPNNALSITQRSAAIWLDGEGAMRIDTVAPFRPSTWGHATGLVEEDVYEHVRLMYSVAGSILEQIDPRGRITDVAPVIAFHHGGTTGWKTAAEFTRDATTWTMPMVRSPLVIRLQPPVRKRAALSYEGEQLAEDTVVLLRSQFGIT